MQNFSTVGPETKKFIIRGISEIGRKSLLFLPSKNCAGFRNTPNNNGGG